MAKVQITPADRLDSIKEYYFSKKNREIDQLRAEGYKAFYIAIGCQGGKKAGIPGVERKFTVDELMDDTDCFHHYEISLE